MARPWRGWPDFEDLVQVAAIALHDRWGDDPGLRWSVARRRVVDEARRLYGVQGGVRDAMRRAEMHLEFEFQEGVTVAEMVGVDDDYTAVDVDDVLGRLRDPRFRVIGLMVLQGWRKQEIAEVLGVHPARVSQMLTEIRGRVTWE